MSCTTFVHQFTCFAQKNPSALTAGIVKNNFKGTIDKFTESDKAFLFLSSVKGTPAYWKQLFMMY